MNKVNHRCGSKVNEKGFTIIELMIVISREPSSLSIFQLSY